MPTIVSFGLIAVATIIVLEGSLAFLGVSVSPPTPSWGNMLNEGSSLLTGAKGQTNPWLVIFPAPAMFLLLISLNVVADKLRGTSTSPRSSCERSADPRGRRPPCVVRHEPRSAPGRAGRVADTRPGQDPRDRRRIGFGEDGAVPGHHGTVAALDHDDTGSVRYDGTELLNAPNDQLRKLWSTHIAMVFQDPMTSLNPVQRIGHQITEPLRIHLNLSKSEAKETLLSLLMQVGTPSPVERYEAYPFELSGGMRQRVMIAIALACARASPWPTSPPPASTSPCRRRSSTC